MSNSLLDQLKKAGLADDKKVKKIKKEKFKQSKQQHNNKTAKVDGSKQQALQNHAENVARDRELNRQRKEAADRKAVTAQIKQLIDVNHVSDCDGEIAHHFTDGGKVQRRYVSDNIHAQLCDGRLIIVKFEGRYELVPSKVAEKIRKRDEACVIGCDFTSTSTEENDDTYAKYQVPDDLMW